MLAFLRTVLFRFACVMVAPARLALAKLTRCMFAPLRSAPARFAPVRSRYLMSIPSRLHLGQSFVFPARKSSRLSANATADVPHSRTQANRGIAIRRGFMARDSSHFPHAEQPIGEAFN